MDSAAQLIERIDSVRGHLLMVDFNENEDGWYRCQLRLVDGTLVDCTFDETLSNSVESALRHEVNVVGVAMIDARNQSRITLHIGILIVVDTGDVTEVDLQTALSRFRDESDTIAHFRQAWRQAMTGKTHPVSELWDDWDSE